MTIDVERVRNQERPRYLAIADAIAEDIDAGRLEPSARLPAQRDLAYRLGVTVGTVSRAYQVLARRRLVSGQVGRGTFVLPRGRAAAPQTEPGAGIELTKNVPPILPPPETIRDSFAALAEEAASQSHFDYAPTAGAEPHRKVAAAWLRRVGLVAPADAVIVFGGAQQALAAACIGLGGGGVMVERLTYPGLLSVSAALGTRLHAVELDADGLSAEDLDRAARETAARLVVLVPTLQNPTNTVMSLRRREAIVAVARRHDLTLVEDDVYGFVIAERPPPIARLAPERTIYITGASKFLAPGLRLAWAVAPPHCRPPLLQALYAMSICRPPLTAELGRHWIESGAAERMRLEQRRETAARQTLAAEILAGHEISGHPASYHIFLRLPEGWLPEAFAAAARERGIGVVPAQAFNAGSTAAPRAVRVSLSQAPDRASLARALEILRDLVGDAPRQAHGVI